MTHLEKILSYCALAPNVEKYCEPKKVFQKTHPIVAEAGPFIPLLGGMLTMAALFKLGYVEFPAAMGSLIGLIGVNVVGILVWNALKKRTTQKKLGYSFGAFVDHDMSVEQTHAILEKLLRLPTTPQTQELKSQLWALADKNLLPQCWWDDVENEIDAWIGDFERDTLKSKLLDTAHTVGTVNTVEAGVETQTIPEPSTHRFVL